MATEQQPITPPSTPVAHPPAENFWVETIKTIGLSVVLALGMRTFVAEARYIPSGSMEPTLQVDDKLIVDKVSYRFSDPQRGDIVVFDPNEYLEKEGIKDAYIKRVIGLPGDVVSVHNDHVTINGQPLSENYPSWSAPDKMTEIYAKRVAENNKKKPEERDPNIAPWNPDSASTPDYPEVTTKLINAPADPAWQQGKVPAGKYLVLGDHRNGSSDGRFWGFVPRSKIVGKAVVKFWPLNRIGGIEPQPAYRK